MDLSLASGVKRELSRKTALQPTAAEPPPFRYRKIVLGILALLFAAATVTYGFVWMYYIRWQANAELGVDVDASSPTNGMEITSIHPGGPGEKAGLRVRDEIVAIDGRELAQKSPDYLQTIWLHHRPGDTVSLTVRRPGQRQLLHITAVSRATTGPSWAQLIAQQIINSSPLPFLVVGLVVLALRVEDRNTWLMALLCAGLIASSPIPPATVAMSAVLRTFMYVYRAIFLGMLAFTFYIFFAIFPRRSPMDRYLPWLKWLIAAMGILVTITGIAVAYSEPGSAITLIAGSNAAHYARLVYISSTLILTMVSLCWNVISTSDVEARRKVRVIAWGTLIGVAPITLTKLVDDFNIAPVPFWLTFIDIVCLTLFPLSFAYAVVKHRVMDIPVLLKQSARYLLVRRGFTLLLLLLAVSLNVVMGVSLSRVFHMQPAVAISIGGSLGIALAWVAAPGVRRTAERIDHAFFRGPYDTRLLLQQLGQRLRTIVSKEQLPQLIAEQIDLALHPISLAIYLRDADGNLQPPPQKSTLIAFPAASLESNHVSRLREPIDLFEPRNFNAPIPELLPLQPECLAPLLSRTGELLGLMVLGAKRSEEPYSYEDKELLALVANQASLVLESIALAERMAERMEQDRRAQHELQIARAVQSKLLPQQSPPLSTLDYAAGCIQARVVGGDYYDFLALSAERVGFVLADIAGKGISGALLMANLQASLRTLYPVADRNIPEFLQAVNHLFVQNTETTHYATVFFGLYDDQTRKLLYANCGHNPPLLLRRNGAVERLPATAMILGLFEPWECTVAEVELLRGDILTVYTDGITEASNSVEEEFGEERLIALLRTSTSLNARELLSKIQNCVQEFSPGEQADDLTAIVAICR